MTFTPDGERTRVTVEHRGFERLGPAGESAARKFGGGWPRVMAVFAAHSARLSSREAMTDHVRGPGPAARH